MTEPAPASDASDRWERRCTGLAVALVAITWVGWAAAIWRIYDGYPPGYGGLSRNSFVMFARQLPILFLLIAVIVAVLPEIASGTVRRRRPGLAFVFWTSAVLGAVAVVVQLVAVGLQLTAPTLVLPLAPLDYLADIGSALLAAAAGITCLSDGRFVPRTGGFGPAGDAPRDRAAPSA